MTTKPQRVYQFDLKGNLLNQWDSLHKAEKATKIAIKTLKKYCKTNQQYYGFYFSHDEEFKGSPETYKRDIEEFADKELVASNVQLAKKAQRLQDVQRIERKGFREFARVENALIELNKSLIAKFDEVKLGSPIIDYPLVKPKGTFLVQVSDTHFNELIDLPYNKYDFIVASQRLMKYANDVKLQATLYNPNKIVVAFTGDMLNSDRRLDELLNKSTNRSKAALISVSLLEQFLNDLLTIAPLDICMVSGNESRVGEEMGYTDLVASDNYDVLIHNMLRMLYRGNKNVNFLDGDIVEQVISINEVNVLLLHGTTIKADSQAGIQQVIGKYMAKNIIIHYVIFGHVHFANVTDIYARSGSLCGGNTYSDYGINLITKASQNLHIIEENRSIKNIRCELYNTDGIAGYPIEDDLEAYNAKSLSKLHQNKSIMEIVI